MTQDPAARRPWARAADAGLAIAAALGALCIALAVAAAVFDVRIVMFRTGSMSPTIPAGSAAIVNGIPAADIRVGDVVMVERAGQLPVTHRVVGVDGIPGADEARSIRMRGDANAVDDPMPYEVTEVRRVVLALPGVAPVLVALGSPGVMGALTIAATALIIVVFWPRRRSDRVEPEPAETPPHDTPSPGSRRARRAAGVGAAVALALTGGSLTVAPAPA
ncbi:signal peptidase I, partial [Microbacterium sp. CPCC 204701]|uniref:signal peptidase I n=1 Tax=Microbacterium sp. CPCC 204701 TaxID=2493084 RepID=UPI000FDB805E